MKIKDEYPSANRVPMTYWMMMRMNKLGLTITYIIGYINYLYDHHQAEKLQFIRGRGKLGIEPSRTPN